MLKRISCSLLVGLVLFGAANCSADTEAQVKAKYGKECVIKEKCGDMMRVDCNSPADGPAYYLNSKLEVLAPDGGLCMGAAAGSKCGNYEPWNECINKEKK